VRQCNAKCSCNGQRFIFLARGTEDERIENM
jgi:hypothetical protein